MTKCGTFISAMALLAAGCAKPVETNDEQAPDETKTEVLTQGSPEHCEHGERAAGDEVSIKGESALFDGPGGKEIVNEKATAALGETHYQRVDNSERLKELCRAGQWSKVRVLEPSWLMDVVGWVRNSALRPVVRDGGGARRYVEADFTWDEDTRRYKTDLLTVINRIAHDNANCASIDPGTLSKSPSRSKPGKPIFFVTCNSDNQPFNVWFEPSDAKSGKSFKAG